MRLLLLLEPGFALALVSLVVRHAHEPSMRTVVAMGLVGLVALLPLVGLARKLRELRPS